MKTVHLLRHGKSGWGDAGLDDHDRPLAPRGASAAKTMGALLRSRGWTPDLILCSSARRTQETLANLQSGFGPGLAPAQIESGLYLASAEALFTRMRALPDQVSSVLFIGHNDGVHICAQGLVGEADSGDRAKLAGGFPTAGLAVIRFEIDHWAELREGTGALVGLVFPREID